MKQALKPLLLSFVLTAVGSAQAADGAALYEKSCASCHGKQGKSGKASAIAGRSEKVVTANIKDHPLSMNTFNLSEKEIKAVAHYVAGLKN